MIKALIKPLSISFALMVCFAFTPSNFLPMVFSLPILAEQNGLFILLLIGGAPFGGVLITLISTPKGEKLENLTALAGFRAGGTSGSWVGLKLAGEN